MATTNLVDSTVEIASIANSSDKATQNPSIPKEVLQVLIEAEGVIGGLSPAAAKILADLPPSGTLGELLTAASTQADELGAASADLRAQFEGMENPTERQVDAFIAQQEDIFQGVIVTGLVAIWAMAGIMNDAIESTQQSQMLTQQLQESMTLMGLDWSKHFSQLLKDKAKEITDVAGGTDKDKQSLISAKTAEFNKINADSQASSSYTSGLTSSVNNSISTIVQAISIDIQNMQGMQKLLDAIAQFS